MKNAAEVLSTWHSLVLHEKQDSEAILAASVLSEYLQQLILLQHPETRAPLLPGDFEVYSDCVRALFDHTMERSFRDVVYMATVLAQPLERWYNISLEHRKGKEYAFTNERWEKYRTRVKEIKRLSAVRRDTSFQLRRIVVGSTQDAFGAGLYLFKAPDGQPLASSNAKKALTSKPQCLHLLEEVANTVNESGSKRAVHLIARHNGDDDTCTDPHVGWVRLRDQDFEVEYHNKVHSPGNRIAASSKGVFCCYSASPYDSGGFDDLFIVDMRQVGAGSFGIGYFRDRYSDLQGIVVLQDADIAEHLQNLDGIWHQR